MDKLPCLPHTCWLFHWQGKITMYIDIAETKFKCILRMNGHLAFLYSVLSQYSRVAQRENCAFFDKA